MPPSARYRPDPRHLSLGAAFFDSVEPAPFPVTLLRFRNQRWADRIGLGSLTDDEWIRHFARFEPLPENLTQALALRYHGHQFQSYNPDLGDGRGFLFAQLRDADGRLLDLATKGSGQTPWSRFGDGRLTLKGGVREVLATEMLEALGVYTSKSFSLIETGEALQRNDEPSPTRSSVLVRLGHSHIRFGTFQRFAALNDGASIQTLLDYSIAEYWPQAARAPDRALAFFEHVSNAVARMAAQWFAAGFVHGVLNTDNTLITGESFDYGPWRFLPVLDPRFTAAYFDQTGLYAFSRQPASLLWNLARLAECIAHHSSVDAMNGVLEQFFGVFEAHLAEATAHRLAVRFPDVETAVASVNLFYGALMKSQVPFERAFFDLAGGASPQRIARSPIAPAYGSETWSAALTALRAAEALPLQHGYFEREGPVTMLIDDVEALWAPIADADDWTAFEAKLRDIAEVREAYAGIAAAT